MSVRVRWHTGARLHLFVFVLLGGATWSAADDTIQLDVMRVGTPAGVAAQLVWVGGLSPFCIYRSANRGDVPEMVNLQAQTDEMTWTERDLLPGSASYYLVRHAGVIGDPGLPPEIHIIGLQPGEVWVSGTVKNVEYMNETHARMLRVVLYGQTDFWYVQPFVDDPFTEICPGPLTCSCNTWENFTHPWQRMAALLVDESFVPPATTQDHPSLLPGVLAWDEFPEKSVISFAGRDWIIKQSTFAQGPGPCVFCGGAECVSVDAGGLHLCITEQGGIWRCAELILTESLGYGTYCLETRDLDLSDLCMVAGEFLWDIGEPSTHREIDFEYARWGNAADPCNSQYVVHPCASCTACGLQCTDHCRRFGVTSTDAGSDLTHYLSWQPGTVTFRTYRGHHCGGTPSPGDLLQEWTPPASVAVPTPGDENFRFNLWVSQQGLCEGRVPSQSHCITIADFQFAP